MRFSSKGAIRFLSFLPEISRVTNLILFKGLENWKSEKAEKPITPFTDVFDGHYQVDK